MYLLLDAASLSEWVPQSLSLEQKRRYYELGKQLREYQLAVYMVEDADLDVLREVFDRVNTTGKPMRREEVFDALVGSRVVVGGEAGLQLVNADIRELGFGELERSTLLSVPEAIPGTKTGQDPRKVKAEEVALELRRAGEVLRSLIGFLRNDAAIPHYRVCPYELPIIVLARFFALFPAPSERNRILLRRWLWRGSIGERLGGASSSLPQHLNDVIAGDEDGSVQLIGSIASLVSDSPVRSALVNKLLYPNMRNAKRTILACKDEGALLSHGIDRQAWDALEKDDAEGFFRARGEILSRWVRSFLESKAECERDDVPSVLALARGTA